MNKIDKYLTPEFTLALLLIISYFLPWVDMAMFVKVVGWDLPYVQQALAEMSKEFTENQSETNLVYGVYLIPLLSTISIICKIMKNQKITRIILSIAAFMGIILSIYLLATLPNVGSGIYMLLVVSILAIYRWPVLRFMS